MSFEANLGITNGQRLLITLGTAVAVSAGLGAAIWFSLSAIDVAAKLSEQVVTAVVYTTLAGMIVIAFWPTSFPPLVIRGCRLRYFLLAPVAVSLTLVMPYAFLFGLAANSLRLRSGSLLPGLVMHALNSLLFLAAGLEILK